ncbi:MATE family efflux transporter [Bacteroides sp. 214]|uniref:MATE family efflux transporter n=1 Tax=Bacteroides sp. 214 TaxID=2302935 RepID=UPI0013D0B879|nr:MATE family efflux transporter [Bacteroides sp. 214]
MFIAFFTSRVVLQSLGIMDYGIYNVVGGLVAMFSFFNSTLSGATTRFLTYELGAGNKDKLANVFRTSFWIHFALGLLIIVLAETIGLWFVYNKLNVPISRFDTTLVVYQLSIVTFFFNILQVPLSASIIAHERMTFFAYIGVFDSLIKLIIAYSLFMSSCDRLILYAFLLFLASLLTIVIHLVYCLNNFEECKFSFRVDKGVAKPMLVYSGWDLYGNFSVMVRSHGLNILQNIFFGPIVNAATGIANTVLNAVMGFAENFLTAIRPQIIKQYASKNYTSFLKLIFNSSRYSFLLLLFTTLPLLIEAEFLLNVWLDKVPEYAVVFVQLSLINNWVSILYRPIVISISATGRVKAISLINGTIYILVLPLSYVLLKMGYGPTTPFILNILLVFFGHTIFTMKIVKKQIPFFDITSFFFKVVLPSFYIFILIVPLPIFLHCYLNSGWLRFIIVVLTSILVTSFIIYNVALDKEEKNILIEYVCRKLKIDNTK